MVRKLSEIKEIVKELSELLRGQGIHVERVILYGSYAADRANEDSDIDLVIISRDFKRLPPLERLEFLSLISWKIPAPLEIIGYTPDEIKGREGKSIFWDEVRTRGRTIYEAA